jgi:two-component system LytT family response regulator
MSLRQRTSPTLTLGASEGASTTDVLRVLVADADGAARQRLRLLLDGQPDIELAAECATGRDAGEQTRLVAPDVVLLDAQTADLDLVTIARATAMRPRPMVVLMGERREHAARGFEIEAVDYLLKPITSARLSTALRRARERRRLVEAAERPVAAAPRTGARMQHLLVKAPRRMYLVPVAEVTRFEAYGNYIRVFARGQTHLIRETMDRLESRLDPDAFVRVHRTSIVRIDCIRELQMATPGAYGVVLADGARVRMSRLYRARFQERFAAW